MKVTASVSAVGRLSWELPADVENEIQKLDARSRAKLLAFFRKQVQGNCAGMVGFFRQGIDPVLAAQMTYRALGRGGRA